MNVRTIESITDTIKMNYLINSRDSKDNFIMHTIVIVLITVFANYISNGDLRLHDFSGYLEKIKNLFRKKHTFVLEGKRSLKNSDYITRTDSLFSDRFVAFWHFINKNSMNNPDINSFKEYAKVLKQVDVNVKALDKVDGHGLKKFIKKERKKEEETA